MTYDKDPPRLRLSGDPHDPLVYALEEAKRELPSVAQLRAVADRFPELAAGALAGSGAASLASMARTRLRAKSAQAAMLALAAAVGVSAAVMIRNAHPFAATVSTMKSETEAPAPKPPVPKQEPKLTRPPTEERTEPAAPPPPAPPERAPSRVRTPVANAVETPRPEAAERPSQADLPASDVDGPSPEAEIALVSRAHQAVASDPARALSLTERHRHEYPTGVLGQESDLIAIEALVELGRKSEAATRAASFRAHYPSSAHLRRLEKLVGDPAGTGSPQNPR